MTSKLAALLQCFKASLIIRVQCMLRIGVCFSSCNCSLHPSDNPCRFTSQHEALREQTDQNWSVTARTPRVPHGTEPLSPSGQISRSTVDIMFSCIRATTWKRSAGLPNRDDARVFACHNWRHLQLVSQPVHLTSFVLYCVYTWRDGLLHWLGQVTSTLGARLQEDVTARPCKVFCTDATLFVWWPSLLSSTCRALCKLTALQGTASEGWGM